MKINRIYFGKKADVVQEEDFVEVTVTYEVIEDIGMQEKIDNNTQQTEETQ